MAMFVKAAPVSEISVGTKKTILVSDKKIALANIDGEFFAIDDTCTHEQCSLGTEGFLDGNVMICGCHGAQFDVTNGKVLSLPAPTNVRSYKTKIDGKSVWIEV
jgi:3-phenylpropionate/trans-cinnamate dioxygenase ferredoxin component